MIPPVRPEVRRGLRVALHALLVAAVGVAGAWAALVLVGREAYRVGPFQVELFARPGRGLTEIALPPFGRILADTHTSPVHLRATLIGVDHEHLTGFLRERGLPSLGFLVEHRGRDAIAAHAGRAAGIAGLGALAAGFLVFRRRWRQAVVAGLAGFLLLSAVGGLAFATYRTSAFFQPTFSGSLALAPRILGPLQHAGDRLADFRAQLTRIVGAAADAYNVIVSAEGPGTDAIVALHISDIHLSPLGMDFAQRLARSFEADLVIDTGDLTSFGTPLEEAILDRIPEFEVPYVFVPGNHDSVDTARRVALQPNAVVLRDGEVAEVAGLRIAGLAHPVFTPDRQTRPEDEELESIVLRAGEDLAAVVAADPPDVLAVHDDRLALSSAALVPLVIAGHFHRFAMANHEGTIFLRVGTTGGGGLDVFAGPEPIPLEALVLYFEGSPPLLAAFDRVTLNPETGNLTISRALSPQEPETETAPAPGPTPIGAGILGGEG